MKINIVKIIIFKDMIKDIENKLGLNIQKKGYRCGK